MGGGERQEPKPRFSSELIIITKGQNCEVLKVPGKYQLSVLHQSERKKKKEKKKKEGNQTLAIIIKGIKQTTEHCYESV